MLSSDYKNINYNKVNISDHNKSSALKIIYFSILKI